MSARRLITRFVQIVSCVLLIVLAVVSQAQAIAVDATWTGSAGDGNWATPGNWDIGVVPINDPTHTYNVVIPASQGTIQVNIAMAQDWRTPGGHVLRRCCRGVFGFVLVG